MNAPRYGTALSLDEAREAAHNIGYPVLVRPSYVLGGRGMEIVYDDKQLNKYVDRALAEAKADTVVSGRLPPRCSSTSSCKTPSKSMSTHCSTARNYTSAALWSTSRRPVSTPVTPPAPCLRPPCPTTRFVACVKAPTPSPRAAMCRA